MSMPTIDNHAHRRDARRPGGRACPARDDERPGQALEPGFKQFRMTPSTTRPAAIPTSHLRRIRNRRLLGGTVVSRRFKGHSPTGFIGNPHVTPKCTLTEYPALPARSTRRSALRVRASASTASSRSTTCRPGPTRPACSASRAAPRHPRPPRTLGRGRTATTASTRKPRRSSGSPSRTSTRTLGRTGRPVHDIQRFFTPLKFLGACFSYGEGCPGETFAPPAVPEGPFLQNPTDVRQTADLIRGGRVLRRPRSPGRSSVAGDDRLQPAQLRPEHHGEADDRPHRRPRSGVDIDLKVPQTQSPTTPSPSELRTSRITLPAGLHDQSGSGRRQGRLPRLADAHRHPVRGDLSRSSRRSAP